MNTLLRSFVLIALTCVAFASTTAHAEEAEDKIKKALSRKVSFEFVDTPLADALEFIRHLANVAIVIEPKAIADGKDKTPINLRVADMDLDKALQWILKLAELEYAVRDQAVFVFTPTMQKEVQIAGQKKEKEKEPAGEEGVLRARFSTGDAIEVDAAMLRHFPQLEQEILTLAYDPAKDAILALVPGKDLPAKISIDAFTASIKKIVPDAKLEFDDNLKLLLVHANDEDDLRRVNAIARALRRAAGDPAPAKEKFFLKAAAKIAPRPLSAVLTELAARAKQPLKIVPRDGDAEARLNKEITFDAAEMDLNSSLRVLSKMTGIDIHVRGDMIECISPQPAVDKNLAVKPPRPPADVEPPKNKAKPDPNAEPQF